MPPSGGVIAMNNLRLHTPANAPAVSLEEARLHLRVDQTDEDTLIEALVGAATAEAEHIMMRAVMPQKWQLSLSAFPGSVNFEQLGPYSAPSGVVMRGVEGFPGAIPLTRPTVSAVDSVTYTDQEGDLVTLDSSAYSLAKASDYQAMLLPAYGTLWPVARLQPEAVQVVFTCGYANAAAVPEPIKAWIKLRVGALFESREAWTEGRVIAPNAFIDHLLDRYRIWVY